MILRHKVILTLSIVFIFIILVLLAISSTYLASSYENLESAHVRQDVILVHSYLESRISGLHVLARDWAAWDDTYLYVTGRNSGFIGKNFAPDFLSGMDLNLIAVTDSHGNLVYGNVFDLADNRTGPFPPDLLRELSNPVSPLRDTTGGKDIEGVISLPEGPLLLAAHPILRSDNSGPPAGMLIMGRYVDEPMIRSIGGATHHVISIVPLQNEQPSHYPENGKWFFPHELPRLTPPFYDNTTQGSAISVAVRPLDEQTVEGRTVLEDIDGNKTLLLMVRTPRDIYQQGKDTLLSFLLILTGVAVINGIIVIFLIDRLVLSRISALQEDVDSLGVQGDLSLRLDLHGNDEISILTSSMNKTLDNLETAQKNLHTSEMSYRTLFETTQTSIAMTDLFGKILYCNRQMALTHGYGDAEDIRGKLIFEFIVPEDRDRAIANLKRTISGVQTRNIEYPAIKRDGSRFWIEMSISLLTTPQGIPESLIVVSSDISRRKSWEFRLRDSEERYRIVFENTGTATVIVEENNVIALANTEFERLSGYSRAEIEGKLRWTEFVIKEDLDRMLSQHNLRRADAGAAIKKYEFRFMTKAGAIRDIYVSVDMIPLTTMSVASLMDITDRKQAEQAIFQSESKLNLIIEASPIPQFVLDKNHIVIHWNKAMEYLTGVASETVLGTDRHWTVFYDNKRPCIADLVVDGIIEKVPEYYSGKYTKSDLLSGLYEVTDFFPRLGVSGKWLYFTSTGIRDSRGTITGAIETLVDITERRLLQEEIGAALKEKEMLLKEIHHRVKNNIQVIASLLNLQSRTVDDLKTKEVLREAQNRVKSIALVHEKLYLSKSLDHIDYQDYLQKISRHMYDSYGVSPRTVVMHIHAQNLSLHIDKAVPCSLIINELISNAFKHAFPDGRKGDVWIDMHKEDNSLVLQYRDNGVGLPESISVDGAESLGMRLVSGLTNQLQGTIVVTRSGGTSITITFPYEIGKEGAG